MSVVANVPVSVPITFSDALGVGRAGLAVASTARLAGSATTVSATSVADRSNGDYDLNYTFPSVGTWRVTSTATIDAEPATDITDVFVETAAQADPAAALAAGTVTVVSPVAATGDVTLYQGDDYAAADSRALSWATTSAGAWPDLTGSAIALAGTHQRTGATLSAAGGVVTPTGANKAVKVELTHAATALLTPGDYRIQVIATLASGDVVTLVGGPDADPVTLTVVARTGA